MIEVELHKTRHYIHVEKILMFKKIDDSLKRNIDKETKNADDDEYIDNPPLQIDNIKSQSQENTLDSRAKDTDIKKKWQFKNKPW